MTKCARSNLAVLMPRYVPAGGRDAFDQPCERDQHGGADHLVEIFALGNEGVCGRNRSSISCSGIDRFLGIVLLLARRQPLLESFDDDAQAQLANKRRVTHMLRGK